MLKAEAEVFYFTWADCVTSGIMILLCIAIGFYFGTYRKSSSIQEYLMGNRKMKFFPITMSLIASYISGVAILGIPTDGYLYGMQYTYSFIGILCMAVLMNYIYLPVLYNLKVTSAYEYLEKRFSKNVRLFGSILFTIHMMTWLPMVIYVSALAINQASGIHVHVAAPTVCLLCIFYTCVGGIKAVVWTDVVQALIMYGAMIAVAIKGTVDIGGLNIILERNIESGRIEAPNLDPNPMTRYTLWSLTIGGCMHFLQTSCINQHMIQRYVALPSLTSAKRAVWSLAFGLCVFFFICYYCGLLIYATYHNCDPLEIQVVKQKDQLILFFVNRLFREYPGMLGIFISGILSASLSSLSTGLNAMAAVILEDFYPFFCSKPLTEMQSNKLMKFTVITFGGIYIGLVYIIEHLGGLWQMNMSIATTASGPALGLFTMGVLLPWIDAKGALMGGILSIFFMTWLCFKAQLSMDSGELSFSRKVLSVEGCAHMAAQLSTSANMTGPQVYTEEKFVIYHVSHMYYTFLGCMVSIVFGFLTSLITRSLKTENVSPVLIAPCMRRLIKAGEFQDEYYDGFEHVSNQVNNTSYCKANVLLHETEQ